MKDFNYTKKVAENYDAIETLGYAKAINDNLNITLKRLGAKRVWDITCGTGLQAIYLHKKGYKVTASDYSKEMLAVAKRKCPQIKFKRADMRKDSLGKFDAVISIFNAIGHLSKKDFEKSLKNINRSLNEGGIYIFDIFNLDYMRKNFITYEFVDEAKEVNNTKYVRINHNKLNLGGGLMTINQKTYIQKGIAKPSISQDIWDMQIYSSSQLKTILKRNGFELIKFSAFDGSTFNKDKSNFILTLARKS
jgi:ubiquinone/menaquinone biosynthesis C-methylase UbiE